jgi:hypothetical protein
MTTSLALTGQTTLPWTVWSHSPGETAINAIGKSFMVLAESAAWSPESITGTADGKTLLLAFQDSNITIADAAPFDLSAAFTSSAGSALQLIWTGTAWRELWRSPVVVPAETDPLSLHLDQTTPQTFTNLGAGTGLMKVTSGVLGLDTSTYLTTESDPRLPAVGTSGNLLTSNGSAWTSAAPAAREKSMSVAGTLATYTGQLRWYPPASIALSDVTASVGAAPTGADLIVTLKKNGSSIGTCTISAGANTSSVTANTTALATTDYVTADITQVGSTIAGADLTVRLRY